MISSCLEPPTSSRVMSYVIGKAVDTSERDKLTGVNSWRVHAERLEEGENKEEGGAEAYAEKGHTGEDDEDPQAGRREEKSIS